MSLPRLNRRLTVEKPVRVPDDAGGYVETWTPVGVVWAEVRARTGREVAASGTSGTRTTVSRWAAVVPYPQCRRA
jgi:SPP1 family predicted phage head-tail adaptor